MISALAAVVPAERSISGRPAAQHRGIPHPCELLAEACDVRSRSRRTLGVAGTARNVVEETLGSSRGRCVACPQRNRGQLASDGIGVDETGLKHRCEESDVLGAAREDLGDAQILGMQAQTHCAALWVLDPNEALVPASWKAGRPGRHAVRVDAVLGGEVAGFAEQTVDLVGLRFVVVVEGKDVCLGRHRCVVGKHELAE